MTAFTGPPSFFSRYTSTFWQLCASSLLFFASFNMIIPELPDYLESLGGEEYKGLIISLFTLTAMISGPSVVTSPIVLGESL